MEKPEPKFNINGVGSGTDPGVVWGATGASATYEKKMILPEDRRTAVEVISAKVVSWESGDFIGAKFQ